MIVQQRVVKVWDMPLSCAEHARFAQPAVVNVGGASMTMNMRKRFVWNCFALVVGKRELINCQERHDGKVSPGKPDVLQEQIYCFYHDG